MSVLCYDKKYCIDIDKTTLKQLQIQLLLENIHF